MYLQDSVDVWLQVINATHPLMYRPVRHQPVLQLDLTLLHHLHHQKQMLHQRRCNSHRALTVGLWHYWACGPVCAWLED